MPPLLLALPAALMAAGEVAITGATIFGFTGVTAALLAGASTLALGTAANLLTGHQSGPVGQIGPSRSPFSVVPDQARTFCYGRSSTGGTIKYWKTAGTDNSDLYFAVACHDTGIDGFESMYVDNTLINFSGGAATNVYVDSHGSPLMWRTDYLGSDTQTADSTLISISGGEWTTNHRLRGMAYFVWHMKYDSTIYTSGIPTPMMVLRGRKIWDPRQDPAYGGTGSQSRADPTTWTWSQNSALCILDYLLGVTMNGIRIGGCGVPIARLDIPSFVAAANTCDENISILPSGTEKRYTMNGFVDAIEDKLSVVQSMLQSMCGLLVYRTGQLAVIAGAAQVAVMSLTDDDLAAALNVNPTTSRQEKTNSITSVYAEPTQLYQVVSAPPLIVPAYEVIDGNLHLETEVRHRFSSSLPTVQRINKLVLGNYREQLSIDAIFKPPALRISVGDTFNWSSGTAGYVSQKMICLERELQENGCVRIVARQETDAKYSWSTSDQQAAPSFATSTVFNPALVTAPAIGDVAVSSVNLVGRDSSSVPALLLTTNAPPSPFVLSIITVYRLHTDTNWHSGPTIEPVRPPGPAYITGISPGVAYDVGFAYVTPYGVSSYTIVSNVNSGSNLISTGATAGSIDAAALAAGAVTAAAFAAGIRPVNVVSSLPGTATEGDVAVLTTDGKLYRYHSGAWTTVVPTVDLSGQITNGQLATGVVDQTKVANGLNFVKIVTSLPGSGTQGDTVFLTTDNKLYRYTGAAWTKATDGADITANTITAGAISAGAIGTAQLAAGAVTASTIAANTITAAQIAAGTITATELAANSVTAAKVATNAITAGTVAAGAINATSIIVSNIIVTGQITANAVTNANVATGSSSTLSSTFATIASITFTTQGGPVLLNFSDYVTWSTSGPALFYQVLRDGGVVLNNQAGGGTCPDNIPAGAGGLDTGASAASHVYALQAKNIGGSSVTSHAPVLVATELKR